MSLAGAALTPPVSPPPWARPRTRRCGTTARSAARSPATASVPVPVAVGPPAARWTEPLARRLDRRTASAPVAQTLKNPAPVDS
ncbi:hypothetical protein [Streptomyces sp. NPDC052693]|uniref:hypothetical protein n=1 Tax=Streptomyces sp. NPDC052693 TaxID=3155814 RepID=UPI003416A716